MENALSLKNNISLEDLSKERQKRNLPSFENWIKELKVGRAYTSYNPLVSEDIESQKIEMKINKIIEAQKKLKHG